MTPLLTAPSNYPRQLPLRGWLARQTAGRVPRSGCFGSRHLVAGRWGLWSAEMAIQTHERAAFWAPRFGAWGKRAGSGAAGHHRSRTAVKCGHLEGLVMWSGHGGATLPLPPPREEERPFHCIARGTARADLGVVQDRPLHVRVWLNFPTFLANSPAMDPYLKPQPSAA